MRGNTEGGKPEKEGNRRGGGREQREGGGKGERKMGGSLGRLHVAVA